MRISAGGLRVVFEEVKAMSKGKRSQWMWVYDPKSKPGTKPPDELKQEVSKKAEAILDEWRQLYIKPVPKNYKWNYLIQLHGRWRGNYFTFGGTYACPHPDAISPTFDTGFARLEYLGQSKFNLAYFRHTGKWWQTEQAISLASALKMIREVGIYHPV
jgi:hypothetical protein